METALHEKYPYSKSFMSVFSACGLHISPYSVQMQEIQTIIIPNTDTFYAMQDIYHWIYPSLPQFHNWQCVQHSYPQYWTIIDFFISNLMIFSLSEDVLFCKSYYRFLRRSVQYMCLFSIIVWHTVHCIGFNISFCSTIFNNSIPFQNCKCLSIIW